MTAPRVVATGALAALVTAGCSGLGDPEIVIVGAVPTAPSRAEPDAPASSCRGEGFARNPADGHCWFHAPGPRSHADAVETCAALGSRWALAMPSTRAEIDFAWTSFEHRGGWIGDHRGPRDGGAPETCVALRGDAVAEVGCGGDVLLSVLCETR